MTAGAAQMPLAFGVAAPRYDLESFLPVGAAGEALSLALSWVASGEGALAISGPAGAGKTHLASIVTTRLQASAGAGGSETRPDAVRDVIRIRATDALPVARLERSPPLGLFIDDAHLLRDPGGLLAIVETSRARGGRVILAGIGAPGDWASGPADLLTRLAAMPRVTVADPDEALMRAVIVKLFRDRQVALDTGVAAYAAQRLPRTFAAARTFVEAADEAAVAGARKVTRALAGAVIETLPTFE